MLHADVLKVLRKQGYGLVGKHSAVKPCHWCREAIKNGRHCYKAKFYGVESHRCLQMTPTVAWCQQRCVYCWRPVELTVGAHDVPDPDDPDLIVEESVEQQRRFLQGYGHLEGEARKRWKESLEPRHAAISLAGEPTLYPRIGELIDAFHSHGFDTTFLVTNGLRPDRVEELEREPTQLYVSLDSPNEELHRRINRPTIPDSWDRIMRTLELLDSLSCRTVIRITAIKGWNMEGTAEEFGELLADVEPDYVEVKAFMCVGWAAFRMSPDNMPSHEEVREFAAEIAEHAGFELVDESPPSRVALLSS
ncbi:4-demethylwyosine synthase TYW1 [Methanopyrus sp.]